MMSPPLWRGLSEAGQMSIASFRERTDEHARRTTRLFPEFHFAPVTRSMRAYGGFGAPRYRLLRDIRIADHPPETRSLAYA
jgi:hypothetical protein